MRQVSSPMADFLIDCYFNDFCKGRKNFFSTPRYAKKLRAMRHSTESIYFREFECEFATICRNILTC
jgi:hypothetical protein